jgi:hypothetical protein
MRRGVPADHTKLRGLAEMNGHEDLDLSASGMAANSRPLKGGTSSKPVLEGVRRGHERCAFESYEVEAESSRGGEAVPRVVSRVWQGWHGSAFVRVRSSVRSGSGFRPTMVLERTHAN